MKSPKDTGVEVRDLMSYTPVEYITGTNNSMIVKDATMTTTQQSLLATVYGQCWPSPSFFKLIKKNLPDRSVRDRTLTEQGLAAACKQSVRWSNNRQVTTAYGKLSDDLTGKDSGKWAPLDSSRQVPDKRGSDAHLCRLTASEFRRLSEQVRVVNVTTGRLRTTGQKKMYRPDMETSKYRREFAACLQAFTDKRWLPYEHERDETLPRRCSRPASTGSAMFRELGSSSISQMSARGASSGRQTPTATSGVQMKRRTQGEADMPEVTSADISRPVSCPAAHSSSMAEPMGVGNMNNNVCTNNNNRLHRFDSLTPIVLYKLAKGGEQPQSVYGSKPRPVARDNDGGRNENGSAEVASKEDPMIEANGEPDKHEVRDTASMTRGVASSSSSSISSSSSTSSCESDSEDDPEDERAPEPTLEEVQLNKMPLQQLRPEQLDAVDLLTLPRGDRRKYDFDAKLIDPAPEYQYPDPLTFGQTTVNLAELETNEQNWRTTMKRQVNRETGEWLDRLQQIQHLQRRTTELEETKARCRSGGRSRRVQGGSSSSRAPSTGCSGKMACCADCLQVACVGNCPGKQSLPAGACLLCREKGCDGHCAENVYNVHSRRDPRVDGDGSGRGQKTKQRPQSSVSSTKNQPPPIRSNRGSVNGSRTKSIGVTFNRGQQPITQTSSLRSCAESSTSNGALPEKDFARFDSPDNLRAISHNAELTTSASSVRLSIVGVRPTATPMYAFHQPEILRGRPGSMRQRQRLKGRSSVIPGKSYFSQKRDSLSTTPPCDIVKCRLNRHARHLHKKRSKTPA